jgi:hypothetical protein
MASKKWDEKGWGFDTDFYRRKAWLKLRQKYIQESPVCELCNQYDIVSQGEVVDHIISRRICAELEYATLNLQTLCGKCHQGKTALERNIETLEDYLMAMKDGKLMHITTPDKMKILLEHLNDYAFLTD